jgi:hypothetical protein
LCSGLTTPHCENQCLTKCYARGLRLGHILWNDLTYYALTPWCRILFEKLIVTQIIKKYPAWNDLGNEKVMVDLELGISGVSIAQVH